MSRSTPTAWALLVVSDPGQADTLTDQESWARETARANNWELTKIVSGVSSGKLGARKLTISVISELQSLPDSERPARLLMIRLERLGRGDGVEALEAFTTLRKLGVTVHTRLDGDVGYHRVSDLLMPFMRFFVGGMENEVRRDKLNAMYANRRAAQRDDPTLAVSTKMPYGLMLASGHYAPKPPEDAAVRLAFELKTQGYGCHVIAKRLAIVAPPMTLKDGSKHPQHWTSDRVRRLILKQSYCGTIVDEATWQRAQRHARDVTRPTMRHEYALGGALRCECGYRLVGVHGPHKSSGFVYYQCRNSSIHGSFKHHRSDRLESQFVALLKRLWADNALIARFISGEPTQQDDTLRSSLSTIRSELLRFDDRRRAIFVAYENGDLARSDLQWRLNDLEQERARLHLRAEALEHELRNAVAKKRTYEEIRALVTSAWQMWPSAALVDRRALAKSLETALGGLVVAKDGTLHVGPPKKTPIRSPKLTQLK